MMLKLIKSMVQAITRPIQYLIISYLRYLVGPPSLTHHDNQVTVIIEETSENGRINVIHGATQAYLFDKINLDFVEEREFDDIYQGAKLKWRIFVDKNNIGNIPKQCFELRFDEKHRDLVFDSYIPFVESKAKEIKSKKRILEMHTYSHCCDTWETKILDHHSSFETIVMKEDLKRRLIDDIDLFISKEDFYKRVGRHWMRYYLLHGLPGAGKTSLVAAIAKYLNFDVYNITQGVKTDFDTRRLIRRVEDSSILLVEDIDTSLEGSKVALSQLLSSLTWPWSNGKARVVIFTTNNKERFDQTLLCRMEMKIYMGHCCFEDFKTLASNYLGISHDNDAPHRLYPDIKRLIDGQAVTPGQVVEELMKSQDVDVALQSLVRYSSSKENDHIDDDLPQIPEETRKNSNLDSKPRKSQTIIVEALNQVRCNETETGSNIDYSSNEK
ncbi:mitochondrial protein-like; contains similarity to AAA-type ATPase [Arabidopsis thaliana]|uniref:Mitochondrial protein-like contains similarity to AAA-type ATPase n=1 Tax=Arabidopsis thaliana TaxID=3702 RepID=Q9LJ50_ARATH|nr:P-loop containing nucleoside triphosphate hydrolases superfamily protein [Arabidopsis thaliana]AEE77615.1 P-loop containing nucleoside triphosphate hydrolases superfamily protein [Arabidopsis thaliana]BAB02995.1 mitochondrial protein-like; contains similarity to AAA-type ATPase [Arabidopsis thaliana]|eukprot:NP_189629.1 P-loop containing nucleoside triphosphate hydrolases superfamily protein [Arabidopsis thaliana]